MNDVIDLTRKRREAALREAGYEYGIARYAEPNPEILPSIVDDMVMEGAEVASVVLLAPPDGVADAWVFTPEQAELVARRLLEMAAEVRERNAEKAASSLPEP